MTATDITDIMKVYARSAQAKAMTAMLKDKKQRHAVVNGLTQSAAALYIAVTAKSAVRPLLIIMRDADEAGYMYQDLHTMVGDVVKYLPSSYKRAVKFGQRDASSEILRTEILSELASPSSTPLIVTYPSALAEMVISKENIVESSISIQRGQTVQMTQVVHKLRELGFTECDYVYEPGQFAVRGSILDVYSYSCEYPYRLDFFGDEIDTLRTFDVATQLSSDRLDNATIMPEVAAAKTEKSPLPDLLSDDTVIITNDKAFVIDDIDFIYKEGFSNAAKTDRLSGVTEAEKADVMRELTRELNLCQASRFEKSIERFKTIELTGGRATPANATHLTLSTTPQPLFHKNFELLAQTIDDYQLKGYKTCILSDSDKQHERLSVILDEKKVTFSAVKGTLHEGFIDHDLQMVLFTDHQIFERFHKYQLKAETTKRGKAALTMKELQEMEPGDYIVHVDFGIGKFGGLVRIPTVSPSGEQSYQEVIRIIYQKNDKVDVSIHSLYKISKYRRANASRT